MHADACRTGAPDPALSSLHALTDHESEEAQRPRHDRHRLGDQRARTPLKRAQGVLVAAARAPREQQRAVGREGESTDRALEAWLWAITARAATIGCTSADIRTVADVYAASQ